MAGRLVSGTATIRVEDVEISESDLRLQSPNTLVARLVAAGVSRLTAERFVEIHGGTAEAGRARPHATSRR